MCGINGYLGSQPLEEARAIAEKMALTLLHRGPDAGGLWAEAGPQTIAFGHRRLSILDLSPAGAQPMMSRSGRFVLTFNGEIYNHLQLRKELEAKGARFQGHSDTETLLAAFEAWGIEATLGKMAGMFAFGLWDRTKKKLFLARDRMGEKPLYYGKAGRDFVFASELKALRAHPAYRSNLNTSALNLFLTLGYVPAPFTMESGFNKLPAAHWMEVSQDGTAGEPRPYWQLPQVAARGLGNPLPEQHAEAELEQLLSQVVQEQCLSDVPLGCFLSGGIDSSLIASFLAGRPGPKLRTFSIGFGEGGFDEGSFARKVAETLGTEHTELKASPADALALVPELSRIYDEPFADASQLPAILLARLARPHVTVALSGDGGDEIFAGYNRYLFLEKARRLPSPLAPVLKMASSVAKLGAVRSLERGLRLPQIDEKFRKLAAATTASSEAEAYWALAAQGLSPPSAYSPVEELAEGFHGVPGLQLRDQLLYLPDDILVKVDRASMSASLETRAPFLDHRVVELAWRLPLSLRIRGNRGKVMLRRLLTKRLDPALWSRPKSGFTPPLGAWLRGPLREWAEDLLSEKALAISALPNASEIRKEWSSVLRTGGNGALRLWPALMAQAWLRGR